MSHQLPPKRYQDDGNPKYDVIRHHPWFATLAQRRDKIDTLRMALTDMQETGMSQKLTAETWGIDERELRDYFDFAANRCRLCEVEPIGTQRAYQMILDHAYDVYVDTAAARPISKIIYDESRLFGVNARAVVELWETDPSFYPTHYRGQQ